jgi:tetratricopeptide (TPR) repeat protein
MNAMLSGRAGCAVLLEKDSVQWFRIEDPDSLHATIPDAVDVLFRDVQDVEYLEGTTHDEVSNRLEDAVDCAEALDLALFLLDPVLTEETRRSAAWELDELLADPMIVERLEEIFCAAPLPSGADLAGAHRYADEASPHTARFLERLDQWQPSIAAIRHDWLAVSEEVLPDSAERRLAEAGFLRAGMFRRLTAAREAGNLSAALIDGLRHPDLIQSLGAATTRQILTAWNKRIVSGATHSRLPRRQDREDSEELPLNEGKKKRRKGKNRTHAFENADQQKRHIVDWMRQGDLHRVRQLIEELVASQLRNDAGRQYVCKSLCDLAVQAQEFSLFTLQLELTARSVELVPDDAWALAQHGKALLNVSQPSQALDSYNRSLDFGENIAARNGRAEVLKSQGRLDDALAAYDEVRREHPEDVVAKNGRAEVLKSQGRLDEALTAYDDVRREHPEDVFAKAGRAEVLKSLGQLEEALAAYDDVSRQHPDDVVAKNGRAEVLKSQGRLDEALTAYDDVRRQHPENVVAKNGRAEVLKSQGRLDEALTAYDDVRRQHPENVVAKNGRAEVLKSQGRLDEALTAYDDIRRQHPEDVVARNGRATLLTAMGRWEDALESLPEQPSSAFNDWIGFHIRGMVHFRTNNFAEAIRIFEQGVADCPFGASRDYFRTALAVVRLRMRQFPDARQALDDMQSPVLKERANILQVHAFCGLNQFDEARALFEQIPAEQAPATQALRQALGRTVALRNPQLLDNDRLIELEIQYLLLAA